MRRHFRWLRWTALALCLALIALDAASRWRTISWFGASRQVVFGNGVVWTNRATFQSTTIPGFTRGWRTDDPAPAKGFWNFDLGGGTRLSLLRVQVGAAEVALWKLLVPAAALTALLWWLAPRRGPGYLCAICRYDLRAIPPRDGRVTCPECGAPGPLPATLPEPRQ
jgi:hypothetical protein